MKPFLLTLLLSTLTQAQMAEKAKYLQQDLIDKHFLDGLYVSIVPAGQAVPHTVDDPGNVIHAGVWTGRYLAGVAYQYSVTQDPKVRMQQRQRSPPRPAPLAGSHRQARPARSRIHQGPRPCRRIRGHATEAIPNTGTRVKGKFLPELSVYSDVSVDNFNAVLYGYALYFDLAADAAQKTMIAEDVDRLMTHLLDNHYRIIDLDGKVTQYGHVWRRSRSLGATTITAKGEATAN